MISNYHLTKKHIKCKRLCNYLRRAYFTQLYNYSLKDIGEEILQYLKLDF